MNRLLVDMARCMMYQNSVDQKWWAEAVNTVCWILHRIPNAVNFRTLFDIIENSLPNIQNLYVFGSIGYARIVKEKRHKWDAKSFKCMFLGYEDNAKGCRVLNIATRKVGVNRTVKFVNSADLIDLM